MAEPQKKPPSQALISPEQLSTIPLWNCEASVLEKELTELNVGDPFGLICSGDPIDVFSDAKMAKLSPVLKDNEYKLNILEVRSFEPGRLDAIVTSYKPGSHANLAYVVGTDKGEGQFQFKDLNLEIKSLFKQGENPQTKGPLMGPEVLMPHWYYLIWVFLAVYIVSVGVGYFAKVIRKKRFYEIHDLDPATAMLRAWGRSYPKVNGKKDKAAYQDFNKVVRSLYKKYPIESAEPMPKDQVLNFTEELKVALGQFLTLFFWLPANKWGKAKILGHVKKQNRKLYLKYGRELSAVLNEIEKTKTSPDKIQPEDCDQLLAMSKKVVGNVYNHERRGGV